MASASVVNMGANQEIIVEGNSHVKTVTLNRPKKFNALTYGMILQLLKEFKAFESNPDIKLVIIKGKGRAFCAGGDIPAAFLFMTEGHWTFGAHFNKKQLTLDYLMATYNKPQVFLINGVVMGGGAGLSMNGRFRVVTENTAFAMPEARIGVFPDVGASYFLSRLPGFFGECIGLTGANLDGAEMLACGLATHFISSKNLGKLEELLNMVCTDDPSIISHIINQFAEHPQVNKQSSFLRLNTINKCFSKGSVEEIIASLEQETVNDKDEWIHQTTKSIKTASPTCLKLFLRSIREGRMQTYKECIEREYMMILHVLRKTVSGDFFEGMEARFLDKTRFPKWDPPSLEQVSKEMVDTCFREVDDDDADWPDLDLPTKRNTIPIANSFRAKL